MQNSVYTVTMFGRSYEISNVAFSIGSMGITWYGVLIALGFLGALLYGFRRSADYDIPLDPMIDVILVGTIGSIIGARLYYVFMRWDDFSGNLLDIIHIRNGGMAIYGALIGALLFGGIMCKIRKINVLSMFDLAGVGFLFGQAVGRWGNFINQEAFGTNTTLPWGMYSTQTMNTLIIEQSNLNAVGLEVDPFSPVHPCFLYESLWCLLGFVLLHFYSKRRRFKGEIFLAYITWYGLGRFFIEGLRTDSLMIGNIRASRLLAGLCVVGGIIALLVLRWRAHENNNSDDYVPVFDGILTDYNDDTQTPKDSVLNDHSDQRPEPPLSPPRIDGTDETPEDAT